MPRKPKFKPVVTRIKLNPEQAVLSCNCHTGMTFTTMSQMGRSGWQLSYCNLGPSKGFTKTYVCGMGFDVWGLKQAFTSSSS